MKTDILLGNFSTYAGFPPSGKVREFFSFWKVRENQGISIPFVESQGKSGKVRENDLAEVTQSLSLISGHIFV